MTENQYDPGEKHVDEVTKYLAGADEAERARVIEAEQAGKGRVTITGWAPAGESGDGEASSDSTDPAVVGVDPHVGDVQVPGAGADAPVVMAATAEEPAATPAERLERMSRPADVQNDGHEARTYSVEDALTAGVDLAHRTARPIDRTTGADAPARSDGTEPAPTNIAQTTGRTNTVPQ